MTPEERRARRMARKAEKLEEQAPDLYRPLRDILLGMVIGGSVALLFSLGLLLYFYLAE